LCPFFSGGVEASWIQSMWKVACMTFEQAWRKGDIHMERREQNRTDGLEKGEISIGGERRYKIIMIACVIIVSCSYYLVLLTLVVLLLRLVGLGSSQMDVFL